MFDSIYNLLANAIFDGTIPSVWAEQVLTHMSTIIVASVTALPFVIVIGMIAFTFRLFRW